MSAQFLDSALLFRSLAKALTEDGIDLPNLTAARCLERPEYALEVIVDAFGCDVVINRRKGRWIASFLCDGVRFATTSGETLQEAVCRSWLMERRR